MAEVRWWETRPGAELRFGVDFEPRPGEEEDEAVRRAAFNLARSMAVSLEYVSLRDPHRPRGLETCVTPQPDREQPSAARGAIGKV